MTPTNTFTDCRGRAWPLRITAGHLADLKAVGLDLSKLLNNADWVAALYADSAVLVAALHVLADPTAQGVSPEDFAYGLDGPALEAGGNALALAIADFFPRARIAAAIKTQLGKILDRADRTAVERILAVDVATLMSPPPATNSAGCAG